MVNIYNKMKLKEYKSKMLVQVHDELIFEIFNPELDEMKKLIRQEMETAFELNIPLAVDIGIGDNWYEAH